MSSPNNFGNGNNNQLPDDPRISRYDPGQYARLNAGQQTPQDLLAARGQLDEIRTASAGLDPDTTDASHRFVNALGAFQSATARVVTSFIRNNAQGTSDQRAIAQQALDNQRADVERAAQEAQAALGALRDAALSGAITAPQGVSETMLLDRKADIQAALEAAGKGGANAKAQELLHAAIKQNDALTPYILCASNGPLSIRAASLGVNQRTLQAVYVQGMLDAYAPRAQFAPRVPGANMLRMLPTLPDVLQSQLSTARQALAQLAAEARLK